MGKILLSTTYLGPVQWYQKLHRSEIVVLDRYESFVKQTYRNRCLISATNGIQALTLPIVHGNSRRICDIKLSDHGNWQHLHWQALQSAYGESPFFEFYADDLAPFYEKRWTYLYDFNMELVQLLCQLLDIQCVFSETDRFYSNEEWTNIGDSDLRNVIRPKNPLPDSDFCPKPYYQVYLGKWGFLPNLSIVDLLFNEGNESIFYL